MAEALVTIAAEGILKKALSVAASEIAIAWGYEEKLTSLHTTLDLIRAKLGDAEGKKATQAVMVWLKQLKDVVGEADDVLDEVHYEMLRRQIKKRYQMTKKVSCLPSLRKLSFRWEIGHKIENVNKRLLEIYTQANRLGLQNEHATDSVPDRLYWRETVPHPEEFKIVGRDDDKLSLIQLLTQPTNEEKLKIVPIVGMGGIGKTALAKLVYNDDIMEQHFNVKAWLCVSVKVDINTLLAKIYESLVGKKPESDLRVNLVKSLEEELGSKRYLLVLDDVWVAERPYWEDFRNCMLHVSSQSGSVILVTTRKHEIGTHHDMMMDSCRLQCISNDEYCWSIFRQRAFAAGESPSAELQEIGREIVKKCRGLPLLLNVIGGMLANYKDKKTWLSIKNSHVWELEDEKERVEESLKLSFDNLPSSMVKQCFAYCSIFKKDTVMEREELVRLWMALGLVQADEERNKDMEDVGNNVFQILVNNSLFQDVTVDEYGYVASCSMHDLVHDVLLSLSKHEIKCLVSDDVACIPKVKHLALYRGEEESYHEFEAKVSLLIKRNMMASTLHTLFLWGVVEKNLSFQRFKCMRILKLQGSSIEKIDDSIGELVHLRYLDLSYTRIRVLPESIGKLYHLQTLNLNGCRRPKKFPISMRNLINLRCCKPEKSIPAKIVGKMNTLRTLDSVKVGRKKGNQIEELGHLKHLGGKLCITDLENVGSKEDAVKADLSGKKNLYKIKFKWSRSDEGGNRKDKDVLEGLQPPADLKAVEIWNFSGDSFPEWVMKMAINDDIEYGGKWTPLDKLVEIKLYYCRKCLSLPTLEHLPLLRDLVLTDMDSLTCLRSSSLLGEQDVTAASSIMKPLSPSLRWLRLWGMERLEKWIDGGATNSSKMISPVLENLEIIECPKITFLDECHPHPLVTLKISDCRGLESIKSMQGLTSLVSLVIEDCPNLLEINNLPNQSCHSLKTLKITDCNKLTSLPPNMFDCFAFLNNLALGPFSKELDAFPSLQGIDKLRNHLRSLELRGLDHWETLPEEIQHLTSLTELTINNFGIRDLPVWLTNMSSIQDMSFINCHKLDEETVKRGAPQEASDVSSNGKVLKQKR